MAWLSFFELDKAVVHVIRLTSFLWFWFQCVCPLMPSCNTYHLTWVSLTLEEGYLLTFAPPDLELWVAPLDLPAHAQPLLLGHRVAPLSHHPWPWAWGSSRILEWVAFPFFRRSSQPRDQTQVSHIAGRFFTSLATREAIAIRTFTKKSWRRNRWHCWKCED